jgi:hypothetical protein
MRPILTPADCKLYPDEQGCDLVEDFSVEASNGKTYTIPAGFWFNGGSIPAAFWQTTFTPFDMRVIDFFLFHDWAYASHCVDKRTADDTLQAGIRSRGLTLRGAVVTTAVRLFGESSWKLDATDRLYMRSLRKTIIDSGRNPADYCL